MDEWRVCKLGDAIELQRGFDLPTYERKDGVVPVYSSSGITGFHSEAKAKAPGVVTGRYGTIGEVFFSKVDYWPLNTTLFVKDFQKNDELFIYYFFKNFEFETFNDKSVIPGINRNHLHASEIILPPLPEQLAIASVLSCLDDKIDLLNRQNKTLAAMAEALFRQWFVEGSGTAVTVADIVNFNPLRSLPKGSSAPYLEMASVNSDMFHPTDWYHREYSSGTKFMNGDTLLARITPCLENGKVCYVTFLDEGQIGWGSTEFIVMHPKEGIHQFLAYALAKNRDFRDFAEGCLEGSSGRQRVNVDHLSTFEVMMPTDKVIDDMNIIMGKVEAKLHSNYIQIRTLIQMRDILLPKLMDGAIRMEVG